MEKSTEDILVKICDLMEAEVQLVADENNEGKVTPHLDINGAISKLMALLVYCGMNVPVDFGPSYNRVHADVEYWKKRFSSTAEVAPVAEEPKIEEAPKPPE